MKVANIFNHLFGHLAFCTGGRGKKERNHFHAAAITLPTVCKPTEMCRRRLIPAGSRIAKVRKKRDKREKPPGLLFVPVEMCELSILRVLSPAWGTAFLQNGTIFLRTSGELANVPSFIRRPASPDLGFPAVRCYSSCQNCSIKRSHWAHPAHGVDFCSP
jgi:hypothetical protein